MFEEGLIVMCTGMGVVFGFLVILVIVGALTLGIKLISGAISLVSGLFNTILGLAVIVALIAIVIWMLRFAAKNR